MIDSLLIVVIDHGPAGGSRIATHSIMLPISKKKLRNRCIMCAVEIKGLLGTAHLYYIYMQLYLWLEMQSKIISVHARE